MPADVADYAEKCKLLDNLQVNNCTKIQNEARLVQDWWYWLLVIKFCDICGICGPIMPFSNSYLIFAANLVYELLFANT